MEGYLVTVQVKWESIRRSFEVSFAPLGPILTDRPNQTRLTRELHILRRKLRSLGPGAPDWESAACYTVQVSLEIETNVTDGEAESKGDTRHLEDIVRSVTKARYVYALSPTRFSFGFDHWRADDLCHAPTAVVLVFGCVDSLPLAGAVT